MKVRFLHPAIGEFAVYLRPNGDTTIGRAGAQADIEITWDRRISRRHARLWLEAGAVWFEDLGSRNGSWLGNQRLDSKLRLEPGTSVLMGETALLVPDHQSDDAPRDVEQTYEAPMPIGLTAAIAGAVTMPQMQLGEIVRSEEIQHTMDLRLPEDSTGDLPRIEAPVEATPADAPRFVDPGRVEVRASQAGLTQLWTKELSKGGLYVQAAVPPPVGSRVEVLVESGVGQVSFNAQVVSVVPPEQAEAFSMPPGAGLQLTDLSGPKKQALVDFVEGRTATLGIDLARASEPTSATVDSALERARTLLSRADEDKLYDALGLRPEATLMSVEQALGALASAFKDAMPSAKPPQAARLQAASTVLERITRVLVNVETRLEYDFRAGHVRAAERVAAAAERHGPDIATLRRVWNRTQPKKVDEAARLTRKAFAARQEQDLERAVRYGQRALEMNPFFEELEKTVHAWSRALREASARGRGRPGPQGYGGSFSD